MTSTASQALVLFAHGARDPRWAQPFERLQQLAQSQLPSVSVRLAFLELMQPRLPEVVGELFGNECKNVTIVPVFLGQGGHVLRDLPQIVIDLQGAYPGMEIKVAQAVGENTDVLNAIAAYCVGSLNQASL